MGAPWRIFKAKAFYPITQFAKGRRGRATRETAPYNNDLELSPIVWTDQSRVITMAPPFFVERSVGNFWIECPDHICRYSIFRALNLNYRCQQIRNSNIEIRNKHQKILKFSKLLLLAFAENGAEDIHLLLCLG